MVRPVIRGLFGLQEKVVHFLEDLGRHLFPQGLWNTIVLRLLEELEGSHCHLIGEVLDLHVVPLPSSGDYIVAGSA